MLRERIVPLLFTGKKLIKDMNNNQLAKLVNQKMLEKDAFSRWLGIEVVRLKPGEVVLRMPVRQEMLNGFDVCHGGITFSLADSALAFASNGYGRVSLALECNISYSAPVYAGDVLTAHAREEHSGRRTGVNSIVAKNQDDKEVAFFRGTVYRPGGTFFTSEDESEET